MANMHGDACDKEEEKKRNLGHRVKKDITKVRKIWVISWLQDHA